MSGSAAAAVDNLRARGFEIAAIETSLHAVDLFDWRPRFPVCVVFGHEVEGIAPALLERCDVHVRIPTLGTKGSINVATAGGVVLYELLRKYRSLVRMNPGSDRLRQGYGESAGVSAKAEDPGLQLKSRGAS
jgi:tRNA G18 (ribose-2'-O)-methylase SpoU